MREEHRVGIDYLHAVTQLLQRARQLHPTKVLYEAGELQWWWRTARTTDDHPQLFWFDDDGVPEAAVIMTQWSNRLALDSIVLPGAEPAWVAHVIERGLAHADASGFDAVELEVDRADDVLHGVLTGHGFAKKEDGLVESWLMAADRPSISELHEDYRLTSRSETQASPHPFITRGGADVEERLLQTSLYRPDLDLAIAHNDGPHAAHGLFWFDTVTGLGLVEPMRTEDDHQQRGLARHVLTSGIDRLAELGAERIKICFETDNAAARKLYLSVGFEPVKQTDIWSGSVSAPAG